MKVTLVHTPCWGTYLPPLGIAYLFSTLKKQGHQPKIFDLNIELFDAVPKNLKEKWKTGKLESDMYWTDKKYVRNSRLLTKKQLRMWAEKIIDSKAEIIGFSIVFTQKLISLLLAEEIKKLDKEKIIIFGGYGCYFPIERSEILQSGFVDGVVMGEGEITLSQLVNDFENKGEMSGIPGLELKTENGTIKGPIREPITNLDDLPFPDFSDFPMEKYTWKECLPILMSKGCVNKCVFCVEHIFGAPFRCRSARNVFNEMKYHKMKYKKSYFNFNDSLINGNLKTLEELCDLLIENNLRIEWEGNARITSAMGVEFLKKMGKAGCKRLIYGVESGSQKVLDSMRKNFRIEDAKKVLRNTKSVGIIPVTNWIVGFPTENEKDFQKTLDFIIRNKDFIKVGPPWGSPCVIIPETNLDINKNKFDIHSVDGDDNWKTNEIDLELRKKRLKRFREITDCLGLNFES